MVSMLTCYAPACAYYSLTEVYFIPAFTLSSQQGSRFFAHRGIKNGHFLRNTRLFGVDKWT